MSRNLLRLLLLILVIGVIVFATFNAEQLNPQSMQQFIKDSGQLAPVFFMLAYILSTVLFLPGSVLTLLGGALFGPLLGTFYSLTAATLGAMLAFLIARYLASDWVAKKSSGKLKQLMLGVESEGWRFVAFTRLVPLFPFNLLNYALGLTKISFSQYSLASYIFMLPGTMAYTYLGYVGKEAATGGENLVQKVLLGIGLLAIVIFIPRLINKLRKVNMLDVQGLKNELEQQHELLLLDVRSEAEFNGEQGHIEQARLMPLQQLKQQLEQIADYKNKPVMTICRTDRRSSEAARILIDQGFENVKVVRMGMTDWNKQNYPIVKARH
jgi:uncharacterized membrane protein YdjX (TVP38/TMEM64 family)